MKKIMLALFALVAFAVVAQAQWAYLPVDNSGAVLSPVEAPCIPFHIDGTTSTAVVAIAGTVGLTGNTVTTKNPGYVSWVKLSTGSASDFLVLSDTDKTNSTAVYAILPPLTMTQPLPSGNADTNKMISSDITVFSPPMYFQYGLWGKMSTANMAATVCYRKLNQQFP